MGNSKSRAGGVVQPTQQIPKRLHILREILETERVYVKGLSQLQMFYIEPLKSLTPEGREEQRKERERKYLEAKRIYDEASFFTKFIRKFIGPPPPVLEEEEKEPLTGGSKEILSYQKIRDLFGPIQIILGINTKFLQEYEEKVLPPKTSTNLRKFQQEIKLAELFLYYGHSFKLYTDFISRFNTVQEQVKKEKNKNPAFKKFLTEQSQKVQEVNGNVTDMHTFDGLFIYPVQRICRYKLLLEDMYRTMEKEVDQNDKKEVEALQKMAQAKDLIGKMAEYCNQKTKESENSTRMIALQVILKIKDLLQPSRKLLKESEETKIKCTIVKSDMNKSLLAMLKKTPTNQPCSIYLFTDLFVIGKVKGKNGHYYKIPLDKNLKVTLGTENTSLLLTIGEAERVMLQFENDRDRQVWLNALTEQK